MSKLFSSSSARSLRYQLSSSLFRLGGSSTHRLRAPSPSSQRSANFCSDHRRNGQPEAKSAAKSADSGNALPQTVLVLPFGVRPLFPGFCKQGVVQVPDILEALQDIKQGGKKDAFCGIFLVKDDLGNDPKVKRYESGAITVREPKDVIPYLHKIGTLAQLVSISSVEGPIMVGVGRVKIAEMVNECPLAAKVELLEDKPYEDDEALKETADKVISTLREVLKIRFLRFHHLDTVSKHSGEFNYSRLADFGAAISSASRSKCQEVLEELDVHKRLKLVLQLLKKDVEVGKLQESIGQGVEEKIRRERKY